MTALAQIARASALGGEMLVELMGTGLASLSLQTNSNPGALTPEQVHDIALEALKHPEAGFTGVLAMLVPFAFFAVIFLIFWLAIRQKQARIQARTEFHKHLLDKFSSGREFSEFLESKGSQRFLDELWSQSSSTQERILSAMRNGIVLAALGLGMLGLALTKRGFLVPAVVALALGIGFLISMAISYHLSKQWEREQKAGSESAPVS